MPRCLNVIATPNIDMVTLSRHCCRVPSSGVKHMPFDMTIYFKVSPTYGQKHKLLILLFICSPIKTGVKQNGKVAKFVWDLVDEDGKCRCYTQPPTDNKQHSPNVKLVKLQYIGQRRQILYFQRIVACDAIFSKLYCTCEIPLKYDFDTKSQQINIFELLF